MSWLSFSDIAKSAFSEAQKRIDKALDIQEDETSPGAATKAILNKSVDSATVQSTNSVPSAEPKRLPHSARKSHTAANKKRGKPLKLGSSLTRNNDIKSPKPSSAKVDVPSSNLSEKFSDIPLDKDEDQTSAKTVPSEGDGLFSKQASSISDFSPATIPISVLENEARKSPFPPSETNSDEKGITTDSSCSVNHNAPQSPSGSVTTSSDIDILDQESTLSESSVSKMYEYNNSLHFTGGGGDCQHQRTSHDNFDSEASDIVRISGYCSSPLSVDGYEGIGVFKSAEPTPRQAFTNETPGGNEAYPIFAPVAPDDSSDTNRDSVSLSSSEDPKNEELQSPENDEAESAEAMEDSQSSTVKAEHHSSNSLLADFEDPCSENPNTLGAENHHCDAENVREENDQDPVLEVKSGMQDLQEEVDDSNSMISSVPASTQDASSAHQDTTKPDLKIEEASVMESDTQSAADEEKCDSVPNPDFKLKSYEQQLLSLSMNNAKLSEENDNLRSEVNNAKTEALASFEDERRQFLDTIDKLQQKLQVVETEKSDLRIDLQTYKSELSQRLSNEQVQQILSEKEESIQGLLQEGETLSKQHLQQNNLIKKLRSKATEREQAISSMTEKIDSFESENKNLKKKLSEVQGQSSEDRGTAERLTEAYQEKEFRITELANQLEDSEEKRRAAQATLDAAYKELADLNKQQVALQSEKELEMKEREDAVRKRMQQELEKIKQEEEHQRHMMEIQMAELRDQVERTEAIATRKDDQWRKEIQDLQQRLQDSELRNHELSEGITQSTRPVLRQMENLQSTHAAQAKTWEALEKSLTSRLADAQSQMTAAQEKERSANLTLVELRSRLTASEHQLALERRERAELASESEKLRKSANEFDATLERSRKELAVKEREFAEALAKARRDRLTLENQLDMEKVRGEVEKKKFQAHFEALQKEKEKLQWLSRSESVTSSVSMQNTDAESVASSSDTFNNFDAFERQLSSSATSAGVYDSLRAVASGTTLLENLQAQLKQRDGEIVQLQGEINTLERTRASMAEEIVRLTNLNEDLEETAKEVADIKHKLSEMEARLNAVLTMYGEKAEEAEELRLDLEDVKAMYRQQIDALLKAESST